MVKTTVPLEPAAQEVCRQSAVPPLIFQLPPAEGRKRLETAQDSPVFKCPAAITTVKVDTGEWGCINTHFILPENCARRSGVILYMHGGGWVFGSLHTHDKLVRELASRTGRVIVFPEYTLSPEARYPVAVEQCYSVMCMLPELLQKACIDADLCPLTVAGDSAGGNLAAALVIMAKDRCGPKIHKQLLYYPVTNACFNTCSYQQFAVNYYLYRAGMIWFWDKYAPSASDRMKITASPLRASIEQLKCLPQTMIINGEADVLRDEGEAYARKLLRAGVDVTSLRVNATIHDFVMLNALDNTEACRAAMDASVEWLNRDDKSRCCD